MSRPFLIPQSVKLLMVANNIRVSDLARLCEVSDRNIYFILQGKTKKRKYHRIISEALGIPEAALSGVISDFKISQDDLHKEMTAERNAEA